MLAWAVQGCLGWQRHGLGAATTMEAATAAYRGVQPLFSEFLGWIDEAAARAGLPTSELAERYASWAAARSLAALNGYEI